MMHQKATQCVQCNSKFLFFHCCASLWAQISPTLTCTEPETHPPKDENKLFRTNKISNFYLYGIIVLLGVK